MQVEVLGSVAVRVDGRPVAGLQTKERALLASLALAAPDAVASSDLENALWGDHAPPTSTESLRAHVSHLRHSLGRDAICRDAAGYRLDVEPDHVDAARLHALIAHGRCALERGDVHAALADFSEAESLWRGEPLTDLADTPERTAQVEQLREVWQQAQEGRLSAMLEAGRAADALPELHHLCQGEPVREQVVGLYMLALYRTGRQVEALRAYRRCRERLADEWGIDPSPGLQRLEWQILRQDPQLALRPPSSPLVAPAPLSALVGRVGQVAAVVRDVTTHRLVTLHGPAGVGKSRLAMEVARDAHEHFPDGVWWVDLTVTSTGDEVRHAVAATLGVRSAPHERLDDALADHLRFRRLLLLPDNCEHVARPLAELLLALLENAPGVHVLATSRTLLHLSGELRREVPPLSTPAPDEHPDSALATESVQLFLQRRGWRAGESPPDDLEEVAALCRQLDGLPLAIELAAAQAQHRSTRLLAQHLVDGQAAGAPSHARTAHHSTLEQAIDWGYATLPPAQRRLFEWLSVFPGDFDEAAVCSMAASAHGHDHREAATLLAELVGASFVATRPTPHGIRYRLLFVLREFARSRLAEDGAVEAARDAFALQYVDVARHAAPLLDGDEPGTSLRQVQREMLNLTSALEHLVGTGSAVDALVLARVMGRLQWTDSADLASELSRLRTAIEQAEADGAATSDPDAIGWAWQEIVNSAYLTGDLPLAEHACARARTLLEQQGDRAGLAVLHWHMAAMHLLGTGRMDVAERVLREGRALAHAEHATVAEAWCLSHLAQLQCLVGLVTEETTRALATAGELADPADYQLQPHLRMNRALLHLARGEYDECVAAARECQQYCRRVGNATVEQGVAGIEGSALVLAGRLDDARPTLLRAAAMARDVHNDMQLGLAIRPLARVADVGGEAVRAALLWGASIAHTPRWPVQEGLFPERARQSLGPGFDLQVTLGTALDVQDVMDIAIG